jgi:hypothetical protein
VAGCNHCNDCCRTLLLGTDPNCMCRLMIDPSAVTAVRPWWWSRWAVCVCVCERATGWLTVRHSVNTLNRKRSSTCIIIIIIIINITHWQQQRM